MYTTYLSFIMADAKLPATLSEAAIRSLPASAYYIPNFISPAEEKLILGKVCALLPAPSRNHLGLTCPRSTRPPFRLGVISLIAVFRHTLLL